VSTRWHPRSGGLRLAVAAVVAACAAGCDRPPSADSLREWTPVDHHSADDDKLALAAARRPGSEGQGGRDGRDGGQGDVAQLVELAWRQQCVNCHGAGGRGDGQMGPMLHASDLSDAAWQGRTTDDQMLAAIKYGKDRMPRFDLPDPVLRGLVARIRSLRHR
jgi:mono/diheme cytochrome c family protein